MLDPSDAGLSAPPKNEEDATISALNAGLLAYDNLSGCRAEISDVLCRFSTGQGFKTRTLYTNTDLTVVTVKIPVLLNGIEATVMRPDLLERSIKLRLPFIPAKKRQTEVDIWRAFSAVHPSCLGALLDAVSCGLRYLDTTRISDSPRMADFCRWVVACEASLPWAPGDFMKVYSAMQNDAASSLAENDSLASALVEWAEPIKPGTGYAITARNLLLALNSLVQDYPKDVRHWPSSPEALAHRLPRLAPTLRAHGVEVTRLQRTANGRPWEFWRGQRQLSLHLAQSKVDEAIEADGEPIAA
jgi:hypothetical protein